MVRPWLPLLSLSSLLFSLPAVAETARARPPEGAPFTCTQVMGVSVTGDWFGAGFEAAGIDAAGWQAMTRTHAFVDLWGNPKDEVWSVPVVSPCAKDAASPDRILFMAVSWELKTAAAWSAALTRVVEVLRAKYPRLRRLELLTMLRAPGNKSCGSPMTVVAPFVDEAVAKVAAAHPDLVRVGPRLEAPSCEVFTKGGPHFTEAGMKEVARVYAAAYGRR
jgi:hypothetical protein